MVPSPTDAKLQSLLLGYGVATTADVIRWADSQIETINDPPIALIELAYTQPSKIGEVITHLNSLALGGSFLNAFRRTLGHLHDFLQANPSHAERISNAIFRTLLTLPDGIPSEFNFIYQIDDHFSLASQGIYGDSDTAKDDLINELRKFK